MAETYYIWHEESIIVIHDGEKPCVSSGYRVTEQAPKHKINQYINGINKR